MEVPGLGSPAVCGVHPDRKTWSQICISAVRDGRIASRNVCVCCDECRAECSTHERHNHGGTMEEEWDRNADSSTGIRCRVCGIEVL
jgi:hypothetical protein